MELKYQQEMRSSKGLYQQTKAGLERETETERAMLRAKI